MSNNDNNNEKTFSNVFAYWDTKDKRVLASRFNKVGAKPRAQQPPQQPTNNNNTNNSNNSKEDIVVVLSDVKQPVDNNNNNNTSDVVIDTTTTVTPPPTTNSPDTVQVPVIDTNNNNSDSNSSNVEVKVSNVESNNSNVVEEEVKKISPDSEIGSFIVVGEDVNNNNNSVGNSYSNNYQDSLAISKSSNYDNYNENEPIVYKNGQEQIQEMNARVEEHTKLQQEAATNYGSVYGVGSGYSVYGDGYSRGEGYCVEDDDDEEYAYKDINQDKLVLLEILCERNSLGYLESTKKNNDGTGSDTSNEAIQGITAELAKQQIRLDETINKSLIEQGFIQPRQPGNYYISSRARAPAAGYSHPNVLTSSTPLTASSNKQIDLETEGLTSWNSEFQRLIEMEDSLQKFEQLSSLEHDFVYAAETYGRIIISEHLLPNDQKTIKPVSVGGIAGGEKYIVQGILFKFAVENGTYGLYGNDENAMKTASHELNGCTSFLNCGVKGLHVPLMAYIDYRGFRLMALSLLPITKKTLVYGSSDAGQTVHTSNTLFNHLMSSASKILNLKPHFVQDSSNEVKSICGPIDIEGHVGTDGRFYLLDFARLSPPEPPVSRGAYLYRLLRLEFIRGYSKPICCDSFSPMVSIGIDEHNQEVNEAYDYLLYTTVPKLSFQLRQIARDPQDVEKLNLSKLFHSDGVNMRHLGQVRQYIQSDILRTALLTEAVSRCLKSLTRELLRREMKKTHLPSDYPYRRIILNFINLVFGEGENTKSFIKDILRPKLIKKFKGINNRVDEMVDIDAIVLPLNPDEHRMSDDDNLEEKLCENHEFRKKLLKHYSDSVGIVLSKQCLDDFQQDPFITFVDPDILDMKTKITRLNIIDYADGMALYYKSLLLNKGNNARGRLLSLSRSRLEQSLSSVSTNYTAVFQLGNVIRLMANLATDSSSIVETYKLSEATYKSLEKLRIDQNLMYLSKIYRGKTMYRRGNQQASMQPFVEAIEVFNEAEELTTSKEQVYYLIAKTYTRLMKMFGREMEQKHFDQGIAYLRRVLDVNPNHAKTILYLGEVYMTYKESQFHKEETNVITDYFDRALILDPKLASRVVPSIGLDPWQFFNIARKSSHSIKDIVTSTLREKTSVLNVPGTVEVGEDDQHFFEPTKEGLGRKIAHTGSENPLSIRLLIKFNNYATRFKLNKCLFSDEALIQFRDFHCLTSMNLGDSKGVLDKYVTPLLTLNLKKLKLYRLHDITDLVVSSLLKDAPELEVLDLGECSSISREQLVNLETCDKLRKLALPPSAEYEDAKHLATRLPNLYQMDLYGCKKIPTNFYEEVFGLNSVIKKVRGCNGMPHCMVNPQYFHISPAFRNDIESLATLSGDKTPLFKYKHSFFASTHGSRSMAFCLNPNHPLIKYRDHSPTHMTNLYYRGMLFNVHEKPSWTLTTQEWVYGEQFPSSVMVFRHMSPTNVFNFTFTCLDRPIKGHVQSTPHTFGMTTTYTFKDESGKTLMILTSGKNMRGGYEFDIRTPISITLLGYICGIGIRPT